MRRLTNEVLYGIAAGVLYALTCLPLMVAYWLGARLGDLAYLLLAKRRRITQENLARTLAEEMTSGQHRAIARATFRNLGKHLVDFARLRHLTPETFAHICTVEGLEHVQKLLERRQGLLVLSAHFGSWELAPAAALCLDTPVWVIARPLDNPVLGRLVEAYRQRCGYHIMANLHALAESLEVLHRGEIVVVLMDQSSLRRQGVRTEFLGVETYTSKGPALLALRARCPVVSAFLVRQAPGHHRLILSAEIPVCRTGNVQRDVVETTQRFNQIIEAYIRRYPDHWFWLHRRWKRRSP
jgi:KDO2-lipid IV(A) lauroyltransferase